MATHSEQARAEAANIRRHAAVAAIKRRALDPAPIADDPREPPQRKKRPRAVFIFPAKYARLLRACVCLRVR
jgi:hypothetical protein